MTQLFVAAEKENTSLHTEVSELKDQVTSLSVEVKAERQLVKSLEAINRNNELLIEQQDNLISTLKIELAEAGRLPRVQYEKYIRPFLDLSHLFVEEAIAAYGGYGWFQRLSLFEKNKWGVGPLPTDYGCTSWYVKNSLTQGYRCLDLLFCVPGWDNDEIDRGIKYPVTAYPSWAYLTYDPDPPRPQSYTTGVAENVYIGQYPKAWKLEASRNGAIAFFKRLDRLFQVYLRLVQNPPVPPPQPAQSGEPCTSLERGDLLELSRLGFALVDAEP